MIQVANATFEDFGIPVWAYRFVVLMVVLGFPILLVVAWDFGVPHSPERGIGQLPSHGGQSS